MDKQSPVIAVAAAMYDSNNAFSGKKRFHLMSNYLNYGLLGLCTKLSEQGFSNVKMFQGKTVADTIKEIRGAGVAVEDVKHPLLLSMPSVLNIEWANDFTRAIKELNPELKIVAGGRWLVDPNVDWIKEKMPNVDFFARGCADESIEQLLDPTNWDNLRGVQTSGRPSKLNYQLLNGFKKYMPSIDVVRGCPSKCSFCEEKNQPYGFTSVKSPEGAIAEVEELIEIYGELGARIYFEAAHFAPTKQWADRFAQLYKERGMSFTWRTQSRIDGIGFDRIETLSHAGLEAIDFGFESGSPTQLVKMQKAQNPHKYLDKASKLIEFSTSVGVKPNLSVLLYPGETHQTIAETEEWLDKNNHNIGGTRAFSLILYRVGEKQTQQFADHIADLSGIYPDMEKVERDGYAHVDLSPELLKDEAIARADGIAKNKMLWDDYRALLNIYNPRRKPCEIVSTK